MRALVTDVAIQMGALVAVFFLVATLGDVPGVGRLAAITVFALMFLYEPVQVAVRGATIGHRRANLRIVSDSTGGRPSFGVAFLRFLLKSFLGLPSFIVMLFTRRHQALHDVLTRTTVQVTDASRAHDYDVVLERKPSVVP